MSTTSNHKRKRSNDAFDHVDHASTFIFHRLIGSSPLNDAIVHLSSAPPTSTHVEILPLDAESTNNQIQQQTDEASNTPSPSTSCSSSSSYTSSPFSPLSQSLNFFSSSPSSSQLSSSSPPASTFSPLDIPTISWKLVCRFLPLADLHRFSTCSSFSYMIATDSPHSARYAGKRLNSNIALAYRDMTLDQNNLKLIKSMYKSSFACAIKHVDIEYVSTYSTFNNVLLLKYLSFFPLTSLKLKLHIQDVDFMMNWRELFMNLSSTLKHVKLHLVSQEPHMLQLMLDEMVHLPNLLTLQLHFPVFSTKRFSFRALIKCQQLIKFDFNLPISFELFEILRHKPYLNMSSIW